uniref:BPTI/Kunitz inhibitor domain-containing protein n=1 Tax=Poecilia latipinna TaxID=48699 RepID=A0A3B3TXE8_9TELE
TSQLCNLTVLKIKVSLNLSFCHSTEFCNLPQDPGQGSTFTFSVYYNPEEDKCLPFFYQGEGGNANRFRSERQCMRNCSFNFETLYPTDACHFKYAPGGCNSKRLRYYYDAIHDKCKTFFWTGCFGNGNRFFDLESCNRTCVGIHGELITISSCVLVFLKKHQKKKAKESQADAPLQGSGIEMT